MPAADVQRLLNSRLGRTAKNLVSTTRLMLKSSMVSRSHGICVKLMNGDKHWEEAIAKEKSVPNSMHVFNYKGPQYHPGPDYQLARLRMIFTVKNDGRRKARLVVGGHLVHASGHTTYASVVKTQSVRILDVIAHRDSLITLCGDIGNAYINVPTREKDFVHCGPEFGVQEGSIAIIVKALYGLKTNGNAF